ncbi:MAG: nuclear transport factor 2 family protein [Chthoniobacter sp.]
MGRRQRTSSGDQNPITHVDVAETVAVVRLEIENWTGYRFTDFFTLLKIEGRWIIMNKVFHKH